MTQEAMKLALGQLQAGFVGNAMQILREALAEHAMQEVQRLGQEIEPDDIASILACRDMLDAQPVPPQRKPLTDKQIQKIWDVASGAIPGWSRHIAYARAIEAAHGIKENK